MLTPSRCALLPSLTPTSCTRLRAIMERMAKRLPTPIENEHDLPEAVRTETMPTTLRAVIRMFPQVKVLTEGQQDITVAVEIEGVLQNRNALPTATVDVIFIIDNGYVVGQRAWLHHIN